MKALGFVAAMLIAGTSVAGGERKDAAGVVNDRGVIRFRKVEIRTL